MEMDDNKFKRLLQEGMEWDVNRIIKKVDSDPNIKDVIAPEAIHDNLMKQIREHEAELESDQEHLSEEEQELIRLGKLYKKKRGRNKYIILIVAVVCALGVGSVSFGDGKKVFTEIQRRLGDRKQNVVNTDNGRGAVIDEIASEEEAYDQISDGFGFHPVKVIYLPEGIEFEESNIDENMQVANIYYAGKNEKSISYRIVSRNRNGSLGSDVEDILVRQYEKNIGDTTISICEYQVEENNSQRWVVTFIYGDAQYSLILMGIQEDEVEEIVENLYFP